MNKFRLNALVLGFILSTFMLSAQEKFNIEIEPFSITNAPGIHSYSWGLSSDSKWLIVGGRLDGLHRRQPWAAFQEKDNNKSIVVIDPVSEQVWSADLSVLPVAIYEQLQSTNQQFIQRENTLYVIGGYGYSATNTNHQTYPNLTVIAIDSLVNAVINGNNIKPYFRQITDSIFKVTGGQLGYLDSTFYLIGGQLFDGAYNPMGPSHGPGFTQIYTNEIRSFKLMDDGTNLAITNYVTTHDSVNLHRRDYNLVPQIFPNGKKGFTAFSGVFDYNDMPYLNSVNISSPTTYQTINNFNQFLSQYHSATLPIYDTAANFMHTIFFGGMSQFTLDSLGNLVEDEDVPFVKTISRISRDEMGAMKEIDLGYVEMPSLVGSGAEFIPVHQYYYDNEILDLNAVPETKTLVGYIYGGIESILPNIFFINTGTQSFASNVIFKVYINKSALGINEEISLDGENVFNLQVYPNPVDESLFIRFMGVAYQDVFLKIFDVEGKLIQSESYTVSVIGEQESKIKTSSLSSGLYSIVIDNGVISDQAKFIKK